MTVKSQFTLIIYHACGKYFNQAAVKLRLNLCKIGEKPQKTPRKVVLCGLSESFLIFYLLDTVGIPNPLGNITARVPSATEISAFVPPENSFETPRGKQEEISALSSGYLRPVSKMPLDFSERENAETYPEKFSEKDIFASVMTVTTESFPKRNALPPHCEI